MVWKHDDVVQACVFSRIPHALQDGASTLVPDPTRLPPELLDMTAPHENDEEGNLVREQQKKIKKEQRRQQAEKAAQKMISILRAQYYYYDYLLLYLNCTILFSRTHGNDHVRLQLRQQRAQPRSARWTQPLLCRRKMSRI